MHRLTTLVLALSVIGLVRRCSGSPIARPPDLSFIASMWRHACLSVERSGAPPVRPEHGPRFFQEIEAILALKTALAQDTECVLFAWGVACQTERNINDTERHDLCDAVRYVDHAVMHGASSAERDRAQIDARGTIWYGPRRLRLRHCCDPGRHLRRGRRKRGRSTRHRVLGAHTLASGVLSRRRGYPVHLRRRRACGHARRMVDRRTGQPAGHVGELAGILE